MTRSSPRSNRKPPRVWLLLGMAIAGAAAAGALWQRLAHGPDGASNGLAPAIGETGSTCSSSRSTRRVRIVSAPTAYTGIKTPAMDRLAAEGTVFERAITPAPLTLPAHTSLMTGLLSAATRGA